MRYSEQYVDDEGLLGVDDRELVELTDPESRFNREMRAWFTGSKVTRSAVRPPGEDDNLGGDLAYLLPPDDSGSGGESRPLDELQQTPELARAA